MLAKDQDRHFTQAQQRGRRAGLVQADHFDLGALALELDTTLSSVLLGP